MKSLVSNVAQPIESDLRATLLQQDRIQFNLVEVMASSKVVGKASAREDIQGTQIPETSRIIVVTVDGKDGIADVEVGIEYISNIELVCKVDTLIASDPKVAWFVTETVSSNKGCYFMQTVL